MLAAVVSISFAESANADTFGSGANTFDIEFVTIGNPGNAADTTGNPNPAGAVPYSFRIGKYEISNSVIDKAIAEGGLDIIKDGLPPNSPATSVTWFEAAKFVNWLNTSTGGTPAYKFDGGGNFQLWTPLDMGYNLSNLYRNRLAKYFLPSMDEWYKAAYYDPSGGIYYDYPTGSDSVPDGIDFAGDPNFDAVFHDGDAGNSPNDITNVGVLSPYGTAGQGGNVTEWQETSVDLLNDSPMSPRWARGSYWFNFAFSGGLLSSANEISGFPSAEFIYVGIRVASTIPEPSTLLLLCFGSLAGGVVAETRISIGRRPSVTVAYGNAIGDRFTTDRLAEGHIHPYPNAMP
jgi:hypothetical protein